MPNVPGAPAGPRGPVGPGANAGAPSGLQGPQGEPSKYATEMFTGWKHLQRAAGLSFNQAVKRSRRLSASALRGKGR